MTPLEFLRLHGKKIGQQALQGNTIARRIVDAYLLHFRTPSDPGAWGLLVAAIDEYRKQVQL